MTLIADSGSTKADWVLADAGHGPVARLRTEGINPVHMADEAIAAVLASVRQWLATLTPLSTRHLTVEFYGSGVRPDQEERMERLLRQALGIRHAEARSDLLGAARALCGSSEGLACILGTGANSCLYDGERIVANIPPMGFILGDEGSGAALGKLFLNALYKGRLGNAMIETFEKEQHTTLAGVIDTVYRQPLPNRWLASLSPFIHRHLDNPDVGDLVTGNFTDFIARNIEPYGRRDLPLNVVGSIAFHYSGHLRMAAEKAGYTVGRILRSPLDDTIRY